MELIQLPHFLTSSLPPLTKHAQDLVNETSYNTVQDEALCSNQVMNYVGETEKFRNNRRTRQGKARLQHPTTSGSSGELLSVHCHIPVKHRKFQQFKSYQNAPTAHKLFSFHWEAEGEAEGVHQVLDHRWDGSRARGQ